MEMGKRIRERENEWKSGLTSSFYLLKNDW